jgi:general secretion pathway protein F
MSLESKFLLKVLDDNNQVYEVIFLESTEVLALQKAKLHGLNVLAITAITENEKKITVIKGRFRLVLFSQELLALLDAGLNLAEALKTLYEKEVHEEIKGILSLILNELRKGQNMSDILETMPYYFPDVYVATVRASERTGDLSPALARFIAYQIQLETIRKKLISTAIYPTMLMIVGGFVMLFLLGYVVPRFSVVYETSGREIPLMSALLLSVGKLISNNWQLTIIFLVIVLSFIVWILSQSKGRVWILNQILSLPFLSNKANEFRLARFYRAISLLLASGIPLPRAMGMVGGLLGTFQQESLKQCRLEIEQGKSLSVALLNAGLSNPVAQSLIKVGERSGQMAEMLERIARFSDDEFERWVDWVSKLLEPILMMCIGLVIGTVVVLMYLPIFELAGSLQ